MVFEAFLNLVCFSQSLGKLPGLCLGAGHERQRLACSPLGHCPARDVGAAGAQREGVGVLACPGVRLPRSQLAVPVAGADEGGPGTPAHRPRFGESVCVHTSDDGSFF